MEVTALETASDGDWEGVATGECNDIECGSIPAIIQCTSRHNASLDATSIVCSADSVTSLRLRMSGERSTKITTARHIHLWQHAATLLPGMSGPTLLLAAGNSRNFRTPRRIIDRDTHRKPLRFCSTQSPR